MFVDDCSVKYDREFAKIYLPRKVPHSCSIIPRFVLFHASDRLDLSGPRFLFSNYQHSRIGAVTMLVWFLGLMSYSSMLLIDILVLNGVADALKFAHPNAFSVFFVCYGCLPWFCG